MALPVVAIIGRPNVGKSSLLNALAGKMISIVEPTAGVTRDRVSTFIARDGHYFELVDTGGYGVVDSDRLYEVSPSDGSRRIVGDDDWPNTAAMGAARGHLYIVSDNQLYEVNPTTGARRSLGKPGWADTKAIVTVGDKLYIVAGGLLHRVNPNGGSPERASQQDDGTSDPRKPEQ